MINLDYMDPSIGRHFDVSTPFGLRDLTPLGAGVEIVDESDPALTPRCLAIQAPSMREAQRIFKKYHHYRMWHQLNLLPNDPEAMTADDPENLVETIQRLYEFNDDESGFGAAVESVTLTFPKALQPKVTAQLSRFPPRLSFLPESQPISRSKSVHVKGVAGTRSLPVLEQPLDIEVPEASIFVCLNNPAKPGWVVIAPSNKPPMLFEPNLQAVSTNDISENAAWNRICLWLVQNELTVSGKPYPKGPNEFPDFRAWIDGSEIDVEMTSVPDMSDWTLKSSFSKLETRISEIARQPGQTKDQVINEFLRKCFAKHQTMEKANSEGPWRPCMLVISNWSAHSLAAESNSLSEGLDLFDFVILIESDEIYCLQPRRIR